MTIQEGTKPKTRPQEITPCAKAHEIFDGFVRHRSGQRARSPMGLAEQLCARLNREGHPVDGSVVYGVRALIIQALNRGPNEPGAQVTCSQATASTALYTPHLSV